jgi:cytochrome c2
MYSWSLIALLGVFIGVTAATASAQQQPPHQSSVQQGRRLALSKCDVCHVVAADQLNQPLLSHYAPSFSEVAHRPNATAQSLEAFLAHHHSFEKMPFPDLTPTQVTDLVSYIISLRGRR